MKVSFNTYQPYTQQHTNKNAQINHSQPKLSQNKVSFGSIDGWDEKRPEGYSVLDLFNWLKKKPEKNDNDDPFLDKFSPADDNDDTDYSFPEDFHGDGDIIDPDAEYYDED